MGNLIWIGALVFVGGTVVVMWPQTLERRRA